MPVKYKRINNSVTTNFAVGLLCAKPFYEEIKERLLKVTTLLTVFRLLPASVV